MPGGEPKGGDNDRFVELERLDPAECSGARNQRPGESQNEWGFLATQEFSSPTHYKSCKESLDHNICCAAKRLKLVVSFPASSSIRGTRIV